MRVFTGKNLHCKLTSPTARKHVVENFVDFSAGVTIMYSVDVMRLLIFSKMKLKITFIFVAFL